MSIFAKPSGANAMKENEYGLKILFLHGLEGSPAGSKAEHLKERWSALCPGIRTQNMIKLKEELSGKWSNGSQDMIDDAIQESYRDALDAVKYANPDIIIGSSLGAALLFKLYTNDHFSGPGVLLAPAVPHLISPSKIAEGTSRLKDAHTTWILGELDTIVSNRRNAEIAKSVGGSLLYSPEDTHRLHKALSSGLIDAAVLTSIESLRS